MVMALYSPQHVGLEFVRQYYTVLHKDPKQLHRFYTKHSFFTHGGSHGSRSEEPIIGQEAIHSKICELKFRDCYAKIISVDSHPTIGEGVVVQVTGTLSNDGLPMRRFMQTFVLAQQAPKKYCVYNDIFRYQDEEFDDDTEGNEDSPDSDSEGLQAPDQIVPPRADSPFEEISNPPNTGEYYHGATEAFGDLEPSKGMVNGDLSDSEDQPEDYLDGQSGQLEEVVVKPAYEPQDQPAAADEGLRDEFQDAESPAVPPAAEPEERKEEERQEVEAKVDEPSEPAEEEVEVPEEPAKPVTWADLAKKNAHASPNQSVPVSRAPPKPQAAPVVAVAPLPQRGPPRRREDSKTEKPEGRRKLNVPPPDVNQIFIGNLPSGITEAHVRGIFKEFGNVVEVRINPKNFGFVAFDNSEPVLEILNRSPTKPIMFHGKVINIEEKRSGPTGGPRGGPKREKEGGGRPKGDGYQRGGGAGGKGGQSGGKGGRGGPLTGGAGYQRQKSGGEGNKGENNRGGRYRERPGGGPRR